MVQWTQFVCILCFSGAPWCSEPIFSGYFILVGHRCAMNPFFWVFYFSGAPWWSKPQGKPILSPGVFYFSGAPWCREPILFPGVFCSSGAPWCNKPILSPGVVCFSGAPWCSEPILSPGVVCFSGAPWCSEPILSPGVFCFSGAPWCSEPILSPGVFCFSGAPLCSEPPFCIQGYFVFVGHCGAVNPFCLHILISCQICNCRGWYPIPMGLQQKRTDDRESLYGRDRWRKGYDISSQASWSKLIWRQKSYGYLLWMDTFGSSARWVFTIDLDGRYQTLRHFITSMGSNWGILIFFIDQNNMIRQVRMSSASTALWAWR